MGNAPTLFSLSAFSLPSIGSFLSVIFFVALALTIIFSAILLYHWIRYGKHTLHTRLIISIYIAGIIIFLSIMRVGI